MAYLSQEQPGRSETNLSETKWRARGDELVAESKDQMKRSSLISFLLFLSK